MVTKITEEMCSNNKRHTWKKLDRVKWCSKCGSIFDGDLYVPTEAKRLADELSAASWNTPYIQHHAGY